jgi:hypothetical protein
MATYYLNPSASGADTGASVSDAWSTLQRAVDGNGGTKPNAGDTVLMKGVETLGATVDVDGNTGTAAAYVKFIGVNNSWENDGTKYSIVANSGAYQLLFNVADYLWFENVDVTAGSDNGIEILGGSTRHVLINCSVHNASSNNKGFLISGNAIMFRCSAYENSNDGFQSANSESKYLACRASNNVRHGFNLNDNTVAFGCLAYANSGTGFVLDGRPLAINCVADSNKNNFEIQDAGGLVFGCRATNGVSGVAILGGQTGLLGMLYTGGNSGEITPQYEQLLSQEAASSITASGTDTNQGYVNPTNFDYNLRSDATYYSESLELP